MESTKDKYYQEAVGDLKSYLKGENVAQLMERARSTPTPEDDRLVDIIQNADSQIRQLKN